jgi:hypothetical protein
MTKKKTNCRKIIGIELVRYVRQQSSILGLPELEIYKDAGIKGPAIEAWEAGTSKPKRYSAFKLEQAIQRRAITLGINRKMNEEIFNY